MLIKDAGIFKKKRGYSEPEILKFKDGNKNEFYSINILVGIEDEPSKISGALIEPFESLNDLNKGLWYNSGYEED